MIPSEYEQLLAERGTLQRLLADIPEEEVLDRGSFLARLELVEDRIATLGDGRREPARARLTFRGRPVVRSHGIYADFGLKATSDFVVAVTSMAAALSGPLRASGPIPNRDQNRLLITSTAVGSFGFELAEYVEPQGEQLSLGLDVDTTVAQALAHAQDLLSGTLGTDDELAEAVTAVNPRARAAIRTFLETLATNDATVALEHGGKIVSFRDVGEVRRSLARLGQDNVHEEQQPLVGAFQGVLPKRRTFEFRLADNAEVITGRIGPGVLTPELLNDHLNEPTSIQVTAILVGAGRPRYVLNEPPEWPAQPTQTGRETG